MSRAHPIELLARLGVGLVLLGLATFFIINFDSIEIETELQVLLPTDDRSDLQQQAIKELSHDFQSRILFVLKAPESDRLAQANASLITLLSDIDELRVVADSDIQTLLWEFLAPYRFQLLTREQRLSLETQDISAILNEILIDRFGLGGTPQLLPLSVDPMAWHSRTFLDTLLAFADDERDVSAVALQAVLSDSSFSFDQQRRLSLKLNAIAESIEQSFTGVTLLKGGVFFHAVSASSAAKTDATLITSVATVGVVMLLLVLFRSVGTLLIPLASVAFGIGSGFAVTYLAFSSLHVMTLVFGASLIGVVIDYALHFFIHEQVAGPHQSRRPLYRALILSLLTSVLAYSVLATSGLAVLSQVAIFSCVGLAVALTVVIALCPLVSHRLVLHDRLILALLIKVAAVSSRISVWIPVGVALVAATVVASNFSALVDEGNNPAAFVTMDTNQMSSEAAISRLVNRYEPGSFIFVEGQSVAIVYSRAREFFHVLDVSSDVSHEGFFSLTQILPVPELQQSNYELYDIIYRDEGVLSLFLDRSGLDIHGRETRAAYEAAVDLRVRPDDFSKVLSNVTPPLWFVQGGSHLGVILIPSGTDLDSVAAAAAEVDGVYLDKVVERSIQGLRVKKREGLVLLGPLLVLASIFLLIVYRDLRAVIIVLIPFSAVAVVAAIFSVLNIPITLFHLMAMYLAVGLGLDYGIFVFEIRSSHRLAERAVSVSAITSLLSFGLLAMSTIPAIHGFGLTLLIGNFVNLIGALWLAAWIALPDKVSQSNILKRRI